MTLPFANFRNRTEEDLAVEYENRLGESLDDLQGEVGPSDQFEVQIDHHI